MRRTTPLNLEPLIIDKYLDILSAKVIAVLERLHAEVDTVTDDRTAGICCDSMAIVRDEYIRTERDDGRIDCHRAVTGLCTGRSDAAAASIARMIGARMHIGDPAHRPFCFTGLHNARCAIRENFGMRDDRLHDLAAGDEFIDLHFPFARDSLLYDDLLILPEATIVPLL